MTENFQRPKQPIVNAPAIVTQSIFVLAVIHVVRMFLSEDANASLFAWAAFVPARYGTASDGVSYIFPGEPITDITSILTYGLLHGDGLHLVMNCVWLLAFGAPIARRMSGLRFLIFSAVCSVLGAGLFYLLNQGSLVPMIGASAAISGLMGGAGRIISMPMVMAREPSGGIRMEQSRELAGFDNRRLIMFAAIWIGFSVLIGAGNLMEIGGVSVRSIAWEAHLGGFLAGLFLFGLFDQGRKF